MKYFPLTMILFAILLSASLSTHVQANPLTVPDLKSSIQSDSPVPKADKPYLVFGVHSQTAPLEWRNNGVDQGFNIELMQRIGQLIDKQIVIRRKTFQQLLTDVHSANSDIDIIAVVSPVKHPRNLNQSDPIYATHANAYTLQGKRLINQWQQLDGKRVAIKSGAFVDIYLDEQPVKFTRVDVDLYETGFQMLIAGDVDVVIAESFVARRLLPFYSDVRSASDPLFFGVFNFISHSDNSLMMKQVNDALRQLKRSGEYDKLVNKWFGTGREKVDLTSTEQQQFYIAIMVSIISLLGMMLTGFISLKLRKQKRNLATELQQRTLVQQQLSYLSNQFQSVLDGIPHGVTLFNGELEKLWSNDNNIELLSSDKFTPLDGQTFSLQQAVKSVINTQQSKLFEMSHLNEYWLLQLHPIGDQVVMLLEEFTEQQDLRQANDKASRLASLGELSAGIAHEVNNPTGIIVHSVAQLQQAMSDMAPAIEHYQQQNPFWRIASIAPADALAELSLTADTINDSANRISTIVSDLKRYAQPSIAQHRSVVDLNQVISVAMRLTANQLKTFKLNVKPFKTTVLIDADEQQIQQVLINLIQNACHACTPYTGEINLTTQVIHNSCTLTIDDNGCGMDEITLKRITEPFFTTRRAKGGTGLGLSVCSRIIEEHGAKMQVKSTLGEGSRFTIIFPTHELKSRPETQLEIQPKAQPKTQPKNLDTQL